MNIASCYQLLELESGASLAEIKASYRRLAQQYHPDINPNDQKAKDKFIKLNQAYNLLLEVAAHPTEEPQLNEPEVVTQRDRVSSQPPVTIIRKEKPAQTSPSPPPPLSPIERQLKQRTYLQIQQLWRQQKFTSSISLVESLAKRLPQDSEVCQWQAIAYQRWGRQLLNDKQLEKARIYLKKALKTDPHNRSLWSEVERDFRRMEKMV